MSFDSEIPHYLIVTNDYLVSHDIAETIVHFDSRAEVLVRRSADEAIEALSDGAAISVAFVHADPGIFAGSTLAQMIDLAGGKVVLMGNAAEEAVNKRSFAVLKRPFSQGLVMEFMAQFTSKV